jgi:arylsulfatase A-like enzyme
MAAGGAAAAVMPSSGCESELVGIGKRTKRPNIIFILADDLGYGDLGCYGQKEIKTPNLDRMATEGMRFTQHYAGSTVCAPSRCALMTGLHTGHCWIRGNKRIPLRASDKTVAELLKKAGYTTALIGKWGLGEAGTTGIPNRKGFDYFFGYLNQARAHNYYPAWLWRNQQKVELRNEVIVDQEDSAKSASTNCVDYSHDLFTDEALAFIERNRNHPFFLYLAYTIPHANNESGLVGRHGMEVPDYGIYNDKDWPEPQKGHAAMITRMDRDIGRVIDKLIKLGLDENTIVFFSSDNGPHKEGGAAPDFFDSNGALRGIKRDLYEGGIRVPFIVRWTGKIESGSANDHISAFWDFLPTCCDLIDIKTPRNIDGISMVPTLLGYPKRQKKHKFLYWEFHEQDGKQAVRLGKFKAVRLNIHNNPDSPLELYKLNNDIGEEHNIAAQHLGIIAKIKKIMKKARTASTHWPVRPEDRNQI